MAGQAARNNSAWAQLAARMVVVNAVWNAFTGIVSGATKALSAVGTAIVGAAKSAQAIQNMAEESGLAVSKLVVLRAAFAETGIGADEAGQAFGQMQKRLAEGAMFGTGEGVRAFSLLGLNMRKMAESGDGMANFLKIRQALSGVKNDALRTALSMEIFGKAGRRMLSIDEKKLVAISASMQTQAQVYKQAAGFLDYFAGVLALAKEKITGFWVAFSARVLPGFLPVIEKLQNFDFANLGTQIGNIASNFIQNFSDNKPAIYKLWFEIAGAAVNALVNTIAALVTATLDILTDASFWANLAGFLGNVVINALIAAVNVVKSVVVNLASFVGYALTAFGLGTLNPAIASFGVILTLFGRVVGVLFDAINLMLKAFQSIGEYLMGPVRFLAKIFNKGKQGNLSQPEMGPRFTESLGGSISTVSKDIEELGKASQKTTDQTLKKFAIPEGGGAQELPKVARVAQFVSSMAKVGGGGFVAGGAMNVGSLQLNETRKQTSIQQQQLEALKSLNNKYDKTNTQKGYEAAGAILF
jgi:hypothetical protein